MEEHIEQKLEDFCKVNNIENDTSLYLKIYIL